MATTSISQKTSDLVKRSFPDADVENTTEPTKLSKALFPDATYTDAEKAEIDQWTITSSHLAAENQDAPKLAERYSTLNRHLSTRTTILGSKPSVADIAVFSHISPTVTKWSAEERTGEQGYHHIVRHVDFVQNSPVFHLKLEEGEKVKINPDEVVAVIKPVDLKAEKARLKKEKEAAAAAAKGDASKEAAPQNEGAKTLVEKVQGALESVAAAVGGAVPMANAGSAQEKQAQPDQPSQEQQKQGKKKEKKEKAPKPQPAKPVEKPLSPSLIDLRVGHILKAIQHPNADSLYVSTIAVGDAPGTDNTSEYEGQIVRTVCSGLNGLVPLEEMQGRKIVAVCNLKPVTMRGVKSCAMVLAASPRIKEGEVDDHKGPVELVNPPADAKAGERIFFEGWEEGEPDAVLNPKKKIWETCQPGFTTTDSLEVGFEVAAVPQLAETGKSGVGLLRTKDGLCSVKSLTGATVR